MGRPFFELLDGHGRIFGCAACFEGGVSTHLAQRDQLLSKQFHSKNGKAYLFNDIANVLSGPPEQRLMTTGVHVVADVYCSKCLHCVGWRYESAYEQSQKYKEGKFILERAKLTDVHRAEEKMPPAFLDDSDCECTA